MPDYVSLSQTMNSKQVHDLNYQKSEIANETYQWQLFIPKPTKKLNQGRSHFREILSG